MYGTTLQQRCGTPSTRNSPAARLPPLCAVGGTQMLGVGRRLAPCARHIRRVYTSASLPSGEGKSYPPPNRCWSVLLEASKTEIEEGYSDAQGASTTFSDVASTVLRHIAQTALSSSSSSSSSSVDTAAAVPLQMLQLADQFDHYCSYEQQQRRQLVELLLSDMRPKVETVITSLVEEQSAESPIAAEAAVIKPAAAAVAANGSSSADGDAVGQQPLGAANAQLVGDAGESAAAAAAIPPPAAAAALRLPAVMAAAAARTPPSQGPPRRPVPRRRPADTTSQQQQQHLVTALRPPGPHVHSQQLQQQQVTDRLVIRSTPPNRPKPRRSAASVHVPGESRPPPDAAASSSSSSNGVVDRPGYVRVTADNVNRIASRLAPAAAAAAAATTAAPRTRLPPIRSPPRNVRPTPKQQQNAVTRFLQQRQQPVLPPWRMYYGLPPELLPLAPHASSSSNLIWSPDLSFVIQQAEMFDAADPAAAAGDQTIDHDLGEDTSSSSSSRKARTEANWQRFVETAEAYLAHEAKMPAAQADEAIEQRTAAWKELRKGRLTGSALCGLLGWFNDWARKDGTLPEQVVLWRDITEIETKEYPKQAIKRMNYGSHFEDTAKQSYQGLVPHERVSKAASFVLWGPEIFHSWIGVSPDGLVTIVPDQIQQQQQQGLAAAAAAAAVDAADGASIAAAVEDSVVAAAVDGQSAGNLKTSFIDQWIQQQTGLSLEGVLEIKCPWKYSPAAQDMAQRNEGNAKTYYSVAPPDAYYMMQVQTQLEVLDREWAVLYYWSENFGSRMSLIRRDRSYFALLWQVMADFWWNHVMPAKVVLQQYTKGSDAWKAAAQRLQALHEPMLAKNHPYKKQLKKLSEDMLSNALSKQFTKQETEEALRLGKLLLLDDLLAIAAAAEVDEGLIPDLSDAEPAEEADIVQMDSPAY